jgi:hypothetical protein
MRFCIVIKVSHRNVYLFTAIYSAMEQDSLLKLAMFISIIGIFLLCILAYFISPPKIELRDVESNLGRTILVEGTVSRATINPTFTFLDLTEGKTKVTAVLFGLPNERIHKGDRVRILGEVSRYKGENELIIEELTLIN